MSVEPESRSPLALWRAVISQTLVDATMYGSDDERRLLISQARSWLLTPNQDFISVCSLADLDPEKVRKLARKSIAEADANEPARKAEFERLGRRRRKNNRGVGENSQDGTKDRTFPTAQERT